MANQNCINKRTGRKCRDFEEAEREYQEAQDRWDKDRNDKDAWDQMFILINAAVFNSLNKDLEYKLEKEEIEGRSLDITMNILRALLNKRDQGLDWKIGKVSSAVHLPCMARYDKRLQFWDTCCDESAFIKKDADPDIEEQSYIFDDPNYIYAQGHGFVCRDGIPDDWNLPEDKLDDE